MSRIAYKSNGGTIGDGTRITRVSGGGQKLEVMVDEKTGRFSEVVLVADAPAEPEPEEPEPVPEPPVDPEPTPEPEPPVDPAPPIPDPDPVPPAPPDPVPQPGNPGPAITTEAELRTALGNVKAGDVLPVAGDFPAITLSGMRFSGKVTLKGSATFERLILNGCANLRLEGLKVMPKGQFVQVGKAKPYLLMGDGNTNDIEVVGCDFWGGANAPNYLNWTVAEWNAQKVGAVQFMGSRIKMQDCAALAVNYGYSVIGSEVEWDDLRIAGFSADAFRACATNLTARRVWATDAYSIDGNHPDAWQAFGDLVNGVYDLTHDQLLEDAIFMEYSTPTDTRGAIGASLQILGYHNSPYAGITHRRVVGASSSFNAYSVGGCPDYVADQIEMWTVPGPKGGSTRQRIDVAKSVTRTYLDKTVVGSIPTTGKPDYSKLPAFRVAAIRGNQRPDIRAILGW